MLPMGKTRGFPGGLRLQNNISRTNADLGTQCITTNKKQDHNSCDKYYQPPTRPHLILLDNLPFLPGEVYLNRKKHIASHTKVKRFPNKKTLIFPGAYQIPVRNFPLSQFP
jgi:hypothetical protein